MPANWQGKRTQRLDSKEMHCNQPIRKTSLSKGRIELLNIEIKKSAGGLTVYINRDLEGYMHILQILMESTKRYLKWYILEINWCKLLLIPNKVAIQCTKNAPKWHFCWMGAETFWNFWGIIFQREVYFPYVRKYIDNI